MHCNSEELISIDCKRFKANCEIPFTVVSTIYVLFMRIRENWKILNEGNQAVSALPDNLLKLII